MDDVHLLYCSVLILVELHATDFWGVLNKQRLFVETKKHIIAIPLDKGMKENSLTTTVLSVFLFAIQKPLYSLYKLT